MVRLDRSAGELGRLGSRYVHVDRVGEEKIRIGRTDHVLLPAMRCGYQVRHERMNGLV